MAQNRVHKRHRDNSEITIWQKRAEEAGLSIRQIAKRIGCSYRYTVAYFSGFVNPHPARVKAICELFNIDFAQGTADFNATYEAWGKAHADTHVRYSNTYKPIDSVDPSYKPLKSMQRDVKEYLDGVRKSEAKPKPRRKVTVNFWRHKIAGKGMSCKDLSVMLGKPYSTTSAYFSGFCMPDNDVIVALCKEFNVDYDRAVEEFTKIHDAWGLSHPDYERSGVTYKIKPKQTAVQVIEEKAATTPVKECKSLDVMYCLKKIYSKVSCEEFMQAEQLKTSYTDFIRFVYGKVDLDTFNEIYIG